MTSEKSDKFVNLGVVLAGFSVVVVIGKTLVSDISISRVGQGANYVSQASETAESCYCETEAQTSESVQGDYWKEYVNQDYRFSFQRPPMLLKDEYENQGGYLFFVKFEETEYSDYGSGVAVGVSQRTETEEVDLIITDYLDGQMDNPKSVESEVSVDGAKGRRYDFVDNDNSPLNSFVVVENNGYTYSISTTADQIERVTASFRFF